MKQKFFIIVLLLMSFVPLTDLFHVGLPITHDGQDHVARIANFYQNLSEGVFIPRWAENLNWGYGHPILMFLYPLPSYITSLIHVFGFSFVDSVKIFFGLAFIASGLAMYLWLKQFLSREASLIGAMLYMFAPYRFVDLYVRGAIGEHAAFVFPPLVLYFLYKLSKKIDSWFPFGLFTAAQSAEELRTRASRNDTKKDDRWGGYWYLVGGSLSLAGLILAHNAISLMFLPIILLYAAHLVWQAKNKKFLVLSSLFLVAFGFALSAFFWMPAFMEGKYTLRDIVIQGSVFDRFSSFTQLVYGPWSYGGTGQLSVQVGIIQWLFVVFSLPLVIVRWLKDKKKPMLLLSSLLFFFFTIFLITEYSQPIWKAISTLQKFQFPWRFLSLSVFLSSVIGAFVFDRITVSDSGQARMTKYGALILFVVLLLFFNKDYWHAKAYLHKPEIFYTGIYDSTTDTGESAPIWSVRFMEKRSKAHLEVYDGVATIRELERKSVYHKYSVIASKRTLLRENTLYFPGWKVLVDGVQVPVEYQSQHNRGIMTFFVEEGKHEVIVKFEETKLRLAADVISLVSLLVLVGLGIMKVRKKQLLNG